MADRINWKPFSPIECRRSCGGCKLAWRPRLEPVFGSSVLGHCHMVVQHGRLNGRAPTPSVDINGSFNQETYLVLCSRKHHFKYRVPFFPLHPSHWSFSLNTLLTCSAVTRLYRNLSSLKWTIKQIHRHLLSGSSSTMQSSVVIMSAEANETPGYRSAFEF